MVSPVHEAFGARVKAARLAAGWSQRALSQRAGLRTNSTVSRVESGAGVYLDAAAAIADALGRPLGDLTADPTCKHCTDLPPAGFTCQACGAVGQRTEEAA